MYRIDKKLVYFLGTIVTILIGMGFVLLPAGIVHAQAFDLHQALISPGTKVFMTSEWIFGIEGGPGVWQIMLGLANAFAAIVLLFFAIVNIAHVQYDTYQLKKSLPLLIIGIILANFSLVIVRMIVDVAQVIAVTFTSGMGDIACALLPPIPGLNFFLTLIILLLVLVAAFIMGFLLWIRILVIYLVAATAPLAFVMMAFTPTQGIFKQWLDWLFRWAFMGSIMLMMWWLAARIGASACTTWSLSTTLMTVVLIYLGAIVPFKLGGAVMGAWGKLGGGAAKLAGNAAWNNPWAKAGRMKGSQRMNDWLRNNRATGGLFRSIDTARSKEAEYKKTAEEQAKGRLAAGRQRMSAAERHKLELQQRHALNVVSTDEASVQENLNLIEAGQGLEGLTDEDYHKLTGTQKPLDTARSYMNTSNRLNIAKTALVKRRDLDLGFAAIRDLKESNAVTGQMKADLATGIGVDTNTFDENGTVTGAEKRTYADVTNMAADFRAKAKAATTTAEQNKFNTIAAHYEQQAATFKSNNASRYNYDAILDRNTSGRRYKEINPRIMEEADITYLSATGDTIMEGIVEPDGKGVGTAEYRATKQEWQRAATGHWSDVEDTAAFAVAQHLQAVQKFAVQAAQGNAEGIVAIQNFTDSLQEAHTTQETGRNIKQEWTNKALENMSVEQKALVDTEIRRQGGIDNFDMRKMTIDNSKPGQANRAFLQRYALSIHNDKDLKISGSPAAPVGEANAANIHHQHTAPGATPPPPGPTPPPAPGGGPGGGTPPPYHGPAGGGGTPPPGGSPAPTPMPPDLDNPESV